MRERKLFIDFIDNKGDHVKPGAWREWLAACVESEEEEEEEEEVKFSSEEEEEEEEEHRRRGQQQQYQSTPRWSDRTTPARTPRYAHDSRTPQQHAFGARTPYMQQEKRRTPQQQPVTPPMALPEEEVEEEEGIGLEMYPEHVDELSDAQLRQGLTDLGFHAGPVVDSTRAVMRQQLKAALQRLD